MRNGSVERLLRTCQLSAAKARNGPCNGTLSACDLSSKAWAPSDGGADSFVREGSGDCREQG
jgi:hypothetical protein